MTALKTIRYLAKKFNLDLNQRPPIEIRNVNRTIIAHTLSELGFKEGAEIGVAQGNHAKLLCESVPALKLHCVDIWEPYPGYNEYSNRIRRYYQIAKKQLSPYNCIFVKKFSMDAAGDFENESLDFVYIDGAHDFKSVAEDICEWTKKVRIGGIVFGHDYVNSIENKAKYPIDVKSVVVAYTRTHGIKPWFVLANDVRDPHFRPDNPGWLFVRQKGDRI